MIAANDLTISGKIETASTGSGPAGDVSMNAGGKIDLQSGGQILCAVVIGQSSNSAASDIWATSGNFSLINGVIDVSASGGGYAGNINWQSGSSITVGGSLLANSLGGGNGGNVSLTASKSILFDIDGQVLTNNGAVASIKSNNIAIATTGTTSIGAVGGSVVLMPYSSNFKVELGGVDSPTVLGITDAEIDRMQAGSITIGSNNAGSITILAAISPSQSSSLSLITGDSIINAAGGSITVSSLSMTAVGNIGTLADPCVDTTDLYAWSTKGGNVFVSAIGSVNVLSGTTSPASGNGGSVNITASGSMTVSGTVDTRGTGTNAKGGNVTLIAQGSGSMSVGASGSIDASPSGTGEGGAISLTAGGPITIQGPVRTYNNPDPPYWSVQLATLTPGSAITIQSTGAIDTSSSNGNGRNISLASAGGITIAGKIDARSTGSIGNGGAIQLVTGNGGSITLQATASVDASGSGAGNGGAISMQAAGDCQCLGNITTVGGAGGGNGGDITLNAGGSLVIGPIDASGAGSGKGGNISVMTTGNASLISTLQSKGGSGGGSGGSVNLTAGGSSGLTVSGSIDVTGASGGKVVLKADQISLTAQIKTGAAGEHAFEPFTVGRLIDVGGSDSSTKLGISKAETDQVAAGLMRIGSATAGSISIVSGITIAYCSHLVLQTSPTSQIKGAPARW